MKKYIYNFEDEIDLPFQEAKILLGTKGHNLSIMTKTHFPVPGGFTITNEVCNRYFKENFDIYAFLRDELGTNIKRLEKKYSKKFGDSASPLLLSIRSGSAVSMPGMMDTILNLGMNDEIVLGLAKKTNSVFAYDCYIRFIEIFSSIVLGINSAVFDKAKSDFLGKDFGNEKIEDIEYAKQLVEIYKRLIKSHSAEFPDDPYIQLELAIKAVINSWNSQRAKIYRKLNNVSDELGTGVTIQTMVFGNYDKNSGTGVLFTRNPVDGASEIFGEYMENAQGEDIVSGRRTPHPICDGPNSMEVLMPKQFAELKDACCRLEEYYKDMQDVEFTIESGNLYILQTRSGKRAISASVKIAYDMASAHIISKKEALLRLDTSKIDLLLHPSLPKKIEEIPLTEGLKASPGAATGRVVFTSEAAEIYSKNYDVILVRQDTCPKDINGMSLAKGIITSRGGLTSHAAVVARGMGKPCISGVADLRIDFEAKKAYINEHILNELDEITINGSSGKIYLGKLKVEPAKVSEEFSAILDWADEVKTLGIRANAETPHDLETAISFKAEGIGLCRTEHMFFAEEKISLIRQIIISSNHSQRMEAIDKLLPLHENDFVTLFQMLNGKPINIRLIDPPLHEFLPKEEKDIKQIAIEMDIDEAHVYHQLEKMSETNPMLGHRGARLGITHPEIYEMQVKAIISAAIRVKKLGIHVNIEIMLPLISSHKELLILKNQVSKTAENVMIEMGYAIEYKIGTMLELPRAAIIADKLASNLDYFSFGTNDLTQTIYGISRDDMSGFMPEYIHKKIFENDPFKTIDTEGVGQVIIDSIQKGKLTNSDLKTGVCGEHGGDPASIKFFNKIALDYVSCSPFRIPVAKIAAAQAAIEHELEK
ncbi:MAG: pyruvate, phosphate dikinase [Rickettsiaceae bacterium]|nr:pyruvate, phosphate dikinase [Rickettsiaceae bacterium]